MDEAKSGESPGAEAPKPTGLTRLFGRLTAAIVACTALLAALDALFIHVPVLCRVWTGLPWCSGPGMHVQSFEEYVATDPNGRHCADQGLKFAREKCEGKTVCNLPPSGIQICGFDQATGEKKYVKGVIYCGTMVGMLDSQKDLRSTDYVLRCDADRFTGPDKVDRADKVE